eukprot:jgi/Hompol1/5836/HPOL_004761-RA
MAVTGRSITSTLGAEPVYTSTVKPPPPPPLVSAHHHHYQHHAVARPEAPSLIRWTHDGTVCDAADDEAVDLYILGLHRTHADANMDTFPDTRPIEPDPDTMVTGVRMPEGKDGFACYDDKLVFHGVESPFHGHPRPLSPESMIAKSRPESVHRPISRRLGQKNQHQQRQQAAPGTPLSDRSVSASSEDGSSSVSSYSTLPSSISSPDSLKLANLVAHKDKSAFRLTGLDFKVHEAGFSGMAMGLPKNVSSASSIHRF